MDESGLLWSDFKMIVTSQIKRQLLLEASWKHNSLRERKAKLLSHPFSLSPVYFSCGFQSSKWLVQSLFCHLGKYIILGRECVWPQFLGSCYWTRSKSFRRDKTNKKSLTFFASQKFFLQRHWLYSRHPNWWRVFWVFSLVPYLTFGLFCSNVYQGLYYQQHVRTVHFIIALILCSLELLWRHISKKKNIETKEVLKIVVVLRHSLLCVVAVARRPLTQHKSSSICIILEITRPEKNTILTTAPPTQTNTSYYWRQSLKRACQWVSFMPWHNCAQWGM